MPEALYFTFNKWDSSYLISLNNVWWYVKDSLYIQKHARKIKPYPISYSRNYGIRKSKDRHTGSKDAYTKKQQILTSTFEISYVAKQPLP